MRDEIQIKARLLEIANKSDSEDSNAQTLGQLLSIQCELLVEIRDTLVSIHKDG